MGRRALWPCALLVAAAGWFALGIGGPLELSDTGMILHPSWMVAHGAVPYRDFSNMFGPSLFYANAAVFRLGGDDLMAMRWWVVVLRAIVAALVFVLARRAARLPVALGAWLLVVATWGTPWWIFNAPYANHYALALLLAGMWVVLALPRHTLLASLLAGVCFGLASTFKQTSGVFGAVSVALFLVLHGAPAGRPLLPVALWRLLRWAIVGGALLVVLAYLAPGGAVTTVVLGGPGVALVAWLAWREWRVPAGAGSADALVALGVGMALPIGAYAIHFASYGALTQVWESLSEIPRALVWYVAFPTPARPALLLGVAALGLLAAAWPRAGTGRWGVLAAALGVGAVAIAMGARVMSAPIELLPLVPVVIAWCGVASVMQARASEGQDRARDLLVCFAVVSLLFLYPAADLWHVLMGLPAFVPLLALLIDRWLGAPAPPMRTWAAAAVAGVLLSVGCAPFVVQLMSARGAPTLPGMARASGITDGSPVFRDAAALLAWLDDAPPERPLAVLVNQQLLYMLADRPSALGADEFLLYGIGFDVLPDAPARALLPPERITAQLDAARPIIVERRDAAGAHFRAAYPEVAAWLDAHHREVATIGAYRVLERTD